MQVQLFSHINSLVGFKLHIFRTEILASKVKSTQREEGTQHAAKLKLYDISARFSNTIITDLKLKT